MRNIANWLDGHPERFNDVDDKGRNYMHHAALGGQLNVLRWLYTKAPHLIEGTDSENQTPFHLALFHRRQDAAFFLASQEKEPGNFRTKGVFSPAEFETFIEIAKYLPALKEIKLRRNELSSKDISYLLKLLEETAIEALYLGKNSLGNKGAESLLKSKNLEKLKILDLDANGLTDLSAPFVEAMLAKNPPLEELYLGGNQYTDSFAETIVLGLEKNKHLHTLNIWGNQLTDQGVRLILKTAKKTSIKNIYLQGNNLKEPHKLLEEYKAAFTKLVL